MQPSIREFNYVSKARTVCVTLFSGYLKNFDIQIRYCSVGDVTSEKNVQINNRNV